MTVVCAMTVLYMPEYGHDCLICAGDEWDHGLGSVREECREGAPYVP